MKRIISLVFFAVFSWAAFGQSITDYFPVDAGNTWEYANSTGKQTDTISIKSSKKDKDEIILTIEHTMIGVGTTTTLYGIKDNKLHVVAKRNVAGRVDEYSYPYPVELASAGQEWRYNDRGDDLRYKTSKASCSFDGRTYDDCILVEERIVAGNITLRTKKSYYAKGAGLVYVTLQSQTERESVFMKLTGTNIKTSQVQARPNTEQEIVKFWEFEENQNSVTITKYKGNETSVSIPSTINGKLVVEVIGKTSAPGLGWVETRGIFEETENDNLNLIIPNSIKRIGNYAFSAGGLKSVVIPTSVISIGEYAFFGTGLESITIPNSVKTIGRGAFFRNHNLESITIPANLMLDIETFDGVFVDYYNYRGKLAGTYKKDENSNAEWLYTIWTVNNIKESILTMYTGTNKEIIIPANINGIPVVGIQYSGIGKKSDEDFHHSGSLGFSTNFGTNTVVTQCTIQNGIKYIGNGAFSDVIHLAAINIPDTVTYIGQYAFLNANNITAITIGQNVKLDNTSIHHGFDDFYHTNGMKKGVYQYKNNQWVLNN